MFYSKNHIFYHILLFYLSNIYLHLRKFFFYFFILKIFHKLSFFKNYLKNIFHNLLSLHTLYECILFENPVYLFKFFLQIIIKLQINIFILIYTIYFLSNYQLLIIIIGRHQLKKHWTHNFISKAENRLCQILNYYL